MVMVLSDRQSSPRRAGGCREPSKSRPPTPTTSKVGWKTVEIDEDVDTNPGIDTSTEYEYNDDGMRVSQTVNGEKTLYLLDGNNPTGYQQILEESAAATGNLLRSYLLGLDVISQWLADNGA